MNRLPISNTTSPAPVADVTQIPLDSLESIRNRLNQIHLSLRKLSDQINHHNRHPTKVKLPNYVHIQSQFQVLITQLHSISSHLSNNESVLKNTSVFPLPSFPTTQHEGLVTTLLRKKPLPEVDEWIEQAIATVDSMNIDTAKDDELAQWYAAKVEELKEEFQFYGFYTQEEREFLETEEGKKSTLDTKNEEAERDQWEQKITDGGKKGLHPDQVNKFMCQGVIL